MTNHSIFDTIFNWAQAHSLWAVSIHGGCCADEVLSATGARYDIERFGCHLHIDPTQADLLIVSGVVSLKAAASLKELYEQMPHPKYVIAVGACACSGGVFADSENPFILEGVGAIIPVDVFIPGCPPRPEAIMNGLIALQEKICAR
jgi:NADH-quinone oxidoreductase subunit B